MTHGAQSSTDRGLCQAAGWLKQRAGLDLKTGKPSPAAVRKAVGRLLNDPDIRARARARALAAEYARFDALTLAVEHIERLV